MNQDAHAILPPSGPEAYRKTGWFLIVADGMGAHAAGEEASGMAADRVPHLYQKIINTTPPDALQRAMRQANAEIFDKGETHPGFRGMGTTCSALVMVPRGALIGHVGDSRVYRIRGHRIEQLTRDHSLAWECGLPEKEAEGIPKNIITRSMGPHAEVEPDLEGPLPIRNGDIFVLCSDGLSGQVSNAEIGLLASQLSDVDQATKALVGLTLARGAPDNVTVIIARAGPEEVTSSYARQEPWPLTDGPQTPSSMPGLAWKSLLAAGMCFFLFLVLNGDLIQPKSPTAEAITGIGAAAAALATVVFLGGAALAAIARQSTALAGARATRQSHGSYQEADCTPDHRHFADLAKSIETIASELSPSEQQQLVPLAAEVWERSSAHQFDGAINAAATALCLIADAVPRNRSEGKQHQGEHAGLDRPAADA